MSSHLVWFLVGVAFLVIELVQPGFVLLFFGLGAFVTAGAVLAFPELDVTLQIAGFVVASLVFLFSLRRFAIKTFTGKSHGGTGSEEADPKIGRTATVTRAIRPGAPGEVKCMGSFWRATAKTPLKAGALVVVTGKASADGLTLTVDPYDGA